MRKLLDTSSDAQSLDGEPVSRGVCIPSIIIDFCPRISRDAGAGHCAARPGLSAPAALQAPELKVQFDREGAAIVKTSSAEFGVSKRGRSHAA